MEQNQNELNQSELNQTNPVEEKKNRFVKFMDKKLIKALFILLICNASLTVLSSIMAGNNILSLALDATFPVLFTVFLGLAINAKKRGSDDLQKSMNAIAVTYKVYAILLWVLLGIVIIALLYALSATDIIRTILVESGGNQQEIDLFLYVYSWIMVVVLVVFVIATVIITIYNVNLIKVLKGMADATKTGEHRYGKYIKVTKIFSLIMGIFIGLNALYNISKILNIASWETTIQQYAEMIKEAYGVDISAYLSASSTALGVINVLFNVVSAAIYILLYAILNKVETELVLNQGPTSVSDYSTNPMNPF